MTDHSNNNNTDIKHSSPLSLPKISLPLLAIGVLLNCIPQQRQISLQHIEIFHTFCFLRHIAFTGYSCQTIHWFNNQSINQGSNVVLKTEGFVSDEGSETEKLKPVYCGNCNEANIKNAKWCTKCGMVLSFTGYQEALKEQKYKDEKINLIEKQLEAQSNQLKALISALGNINDEPSQSYGANIIQLWHFECLFVIIKKDGSKK